MNRTQYLVILTLIAGILLSQREAIGQTKIVEKGGGFTYSSPKGWKVTTIPGLKFKAAIGPVTDAFSVNITVVDEELNGSIEEYARRNQISLAKMLPGYK